MSEHKRFVDMAVQPLKGTSSIRQMPPDYTSALYLALMCDGAEIQTKGYKRHCISHFRTHFQPRLGNIVFDVEGLDFGIVPEKTKVEGFALISEDAIIVTQALPQRAIEFGPGPIRVSKVRLLKMPIVPGGAS